MWSFILTAKQIHILSSLSEKILDSSFSRIPKLSPPYSRWKATFLFLFSSVMEISLLRYPPSLHPHSPWVTLCNLAGLPASFRTAQVNYRPGCHQGRLIIAGRVRGQQKLPEATYWESQQRAAVPWFLTPCHKTHQTP